MPENPIHHSTLVFERHYDSSPTRVFVEFADPLVRAKWSTSSGDELIYDESSFELGGRDIFRCGPKGDLRFRGETIYHLIAPDRCVISSETLHAGDQQLAVSLNTLELK
jgi:uncharacterized protein YndB with AHSA1/START domain